MESKLKPCPFCLSNNTYLLDANEIDQTTNPQTNPFWAVACCMNQQEEMNVCNKLGCGATGGYRPTRREAIEAWNRRIEVVNEQSGNMAKG